jgi:hydrogenase-4 component J
MRAAGLADTTVAAGLADRAGTGGERARASVGEARAASPSCSREARYIFYRLVSKVVGTDEDCSQRSRDIAYYTLAVGHHTGILDCFDVVLHCDDDELDALLSLLSEEGYARFKLDGLRRFGEITIEQEHAMRLLDELRRLIREKRPGAFSGWAEGLIEQLEAVAREPVVYLIGRRII